jgi:hypothetical protein
MSDIEAGTTDLYPVRAAMLRHRGPYIAETILLDRYDEDGWQRITRDRDGEYLGRLRSQSIGEIVYFLERPDKHSSRHPHFRAAINALGASLDDAEEAREA